MPYKRKSQLRMLQRQKMNKQLLAMQVASRTAIDEDTVGKVVDTLFDTIIENIHDGVRVSIREFGQWHMDKLPERTIYSPAQDMKIVLPVRDKVIFKPGTRLQHKSSRKKEDEQGAG